MRLRDTTALVAACGLLASSQSVDARGIRFDRLSVEDGLSQSAVNTMLQDRTGFLWLATQDGLNRFDGIEFQVFKTDSADPDSIGGVWVDAIVEDPSGDLWIGTRGGGLDRWLRDSGIFEHHRHDPADPNSLSGNEVRSLLLDRDSFLWVGTEASGLNRRDPATGHFAHFRHDPDDPRSLSHDKVVALLQDEAGRIWVGTRGGGVNLFEPETGTFRHFRHDPSDPQSLNDDNIRAFLEESNGDFWVATHGGLARMNRDTSKFERFAHDPENPRSLSGNRVRALLEDSHRRIWVATDSGLNLFDRERGDFELYRHEPADLNSLGSNRVGSLLEDRGGVLWVGTQGGGAAKWDPDHWTLANDPLRSPEMGSSDVLSLALDAESRLWIGTAGGGLHSLDRQTGDLIRYQHDANDPRSLSADAVTALLTDSAGTVWAGTMVAGLNRFDPATGAFTRFPHDPSRSESLGADGVMEIFEDQERRLWVGTWGGGISRLDRATGTFEHWRHDPDDPKSLSGNRITSFAPGPAGKLWVGTFRAGLNLFDPKTGASLRLRNDPDLETSLSHDSVMTLVRDLDGTLWVGTQLGLNRLEAFDEAASEAVFRRYRERDGLPGEFIFGVHPDDRGNLWISTNSGLSKFDPGTETFRNFDSSHGLQSDEFNMNASLAGPDGELFFGGINGYNAFDPARVTGNTSVPPVVLTSFSKLNQEVKLDRPLADLEELVLDHEENVFSFEFAALDFTAPERNRYRYKLEGFHREWIDHGTRRRVTFTNLDPGNYTLRIQGSNNDGVWNEAGQSIRVVITPPFWMTWWFRLLLILAGAGVVFLILSVRTRGIRKRNEQLKEMVAERTGELQEAQDQLLRRERLAVLGELAGSVAHELRNPLGVIKNSAYFLKLTHKGDSPKTTEHLAMIESEIGRSNRIITELLDFGRDPQPEFTRIVLQELAERVVSSMRLPDTIELELGLDPDDIVVEADEGQIERTLENLVRNAIQAMPEGGDLRVECRRDGEAAILSVADSGVGIEPENVLKVFEPLFTTKATGIGLGLPVCQRYARLNGGRIVVGSRPGEGATFQLILPLASGASLPDEPAALSG